MAHVLVAEADRHIRDLITAVLEDEDSGHWVTCVDNPWDFLSVMRSTLHPLVVIFEFRMITWGQDARIRTYDIIVREEADLARHKFIVMQPSGWEHPADLQALYDRLGALKLFVPFTVDMLLDLVAELVKESETVT